MNRPQQGFFTKKELRVCILALSDLSNKDIADRLFVTEKAVKFHLTNINKKVGSKNRVSLKQKVSEGLDIAA